MVGHFAGPGIIRKQDLSSISPCLRCKTSKNPPSAFLLDCQRGIFSANCDCEFAIRFDHSTTVAGYEPEKYLKQYRDAGSDVNGLRRIDYAARKDAINAQKRAAYAARKLSTNEEKTATIKTTDGISRQFVSEQLFQKHYDKHLPEFGEISKEKYLEKANALADAPLSEDVVQLVRSDGSVAKYCYSTNEFVVVTADGNIRTYFKPETKGAYWDEEIERNK